MNSPPSPQLDLLDTGASADAPAIEARLFGIGLTHAQFMEFMAKEWLMPGPNGRLLTGLSEAYAEEASKAPQVAVWFDRLKLPAHDVLAFCDGSWGQRALDELDERVEFMSWDGPLPLFAVSHFVFETDAARAHLISLARSFGDIEIPPVPMEIRAFKTKLPATQTTAVGTTAVPANWSALRGAAAMASSFVPAIGPWLTLLCDSLTASGASDSADMVSAPWWRVAPWAITSDTSPDKSPLWRAIFSQLPAARLSKDWRPKAILADICTDADRLGEDPTLIKKLLRSTTALLEDRATIKSSELVDEPLALALQLLLLRPNPDRFVRWPDDWPAVPPAAWWTGLVLSGYTNGYDSLPTALRGSLAARKLLSLRTWASASEVSAGPWVQMTKAVLSWEINEDGIRLLADEEVWGEHKVGSRGRWYHADFNSHVVLTAAKDLADKIHPRLLSEHLVLTDGNFELLGEGSARLVGKGTTLRVDGRLELKLSNSIRTDKRLDIPAFRQWLAVGSIAQRLPKPPGVLAVFRSANTDTSHSMPVVQDGELAVVPARMTVMPDSNVETPLIRSPVRSRHGPAAPHVVRPEGLELIVEFINEDEERELLETIDNSLWDATMNRRVQHYGWKYDYKLRKVNESAYLGELPGWAKGLAKRLVESGFVTEEPDQVIVNEYCGKQGISKHMDCIECFRGPIVTISLREAWEMIFTRSSSRGTSERFPQVLPRRSAAILSGEARTDWLHEIPNRLREQGVPRGRRVSITFRRVNSTAQMPS